MNQELKGLLRSVLKEELEPIHKQLNVLSQDVKMLKQDVNVLSQDVKMLKQDVKVLDQDVKMLKQDVKVLKQDVKVLEQDAKELKDVQNQILKVIGQIPAQYESLEQFVGNQERVIEALSYRSLKHESEIKDLNRMIKNQ